MTVKEVAEVLKVGESTIKRTIEKLSPVLGALALNNYGGYLLSEYQVTLIKQEIQKHHNLENRNIDNITTEQEENETIIKALSILKRRSNEYKQRAEIAEQQLIDQKPKVEFAEIITADQHSTFDMAGVAQELKLPYGKIILFRELRAAQILKNDNTPYQRYVDSGYFKVYPVSTPIGTKLTTKVTQKGIDFIRKIIKENAEK